ncbi:hypothetical protein chiPu_0009027 [Chiloscyllium punctatum]|uniref:Uncharacterized protein n=1 Tax=Chiloscyllium punctatum TaxID=137246 RepID=A0A401SJJ1_CHIPU|nr:hypothetical protein [Chiloscyllium punctatum]
MCCISTTGHVNGKNDDAATCIITWISFQPFFFSLLLIPVTTIKATAVNVKIKHTEEEMMQMKFLNKYKRDSGA